MKYTKEFIKSVAPFGASHYVTKGRCIVFFRNIFDGTYDKCIYWTNLKELDNWYTKRENVPYSYPDLKEI